MKFLRVSLFALLFMSAVSTSAEAVVIFTEFFDSENGGVPTTNFNGFSQWTVSDGTVDLTGPGLFDPFPGNGLYLDLDGSSQDAGKLTSKLLALPVGDYSVRFNMAGNQRGGSPDTVDVSLGSFFATSLTFDPFDAPILFTGNFSVLASENASLIFDHQGNDNVGLLLDNIVVERIAGEPENPVIPEPTTVLLFGTGLIGAAIRRKKV